MEADNKWEFAAAILWPKLIECAKNSNFITYTAAAQWCGYQQCPTGFGNVLGMIAKNAMKRDGRGSIPLLFNRAAVMPGTG